jgi:hypothetical protein
MSPSSPGINATPIPLPCARQANLTGACMQALPDIYCPDGHVSGYVYNVYKAAPHLLHMHGNGSSVRMMQMRAAIACDSWWKQHSATILQQEGSSAGCAHTVLLKHDHADANWKSWTHKCCVMLSTMTWQQVTCPSCEHAVWLMR